MLVEVTKRLREHERHSLRAARPNAECAFLRPLEDLRRVGRALPGVWNQ